MSQLDDASIWDAIDRKLQREKKADLILLLKELTDVSPDARRFVEARYLPQKKTADRIAPYRQVIQSQFTISDWNNTVEWNFVGIQKAIDDYAQSSQGDVAGLGELWVVALETAVKFADSINLQADDFDGGLADLAESYVEHMQHHPQLRSRYTRRVKAVQRKGNEMGYYGMVEILDDLYSYDSTG